MKIAIVGGGIAGLANAYHAARKGHEVCLFERNRLAMGASVRNFGNFWPIGVRPGPLLAAAFRSAEIWREISTAARIPFNPCGSLHLAYHSDEWATIQEFAASANDRGYIVEIWNRQLVLDHSPAANPNGLLGGLFSRSEGCIDSRTAIHMLPQWLSETYGVRCFFDTLISEIDLPQVRASDGRVWEVDRVVVCSGHDFQTLFPAAFVDSGVRKVKLQMYSTAPQPENWRIGPSLAGGLSFLHYAAFKDCPSVPKIAARTLATMPELERYGIHVLIAQNSLGEVIVGDSHEYDDDIDWQDKEEIGALIWREARKLASIRDGRIARSWHGIYARHGDLMEFETSPAPGVDIVIVTSGLGMTMSLGLAERRWTEK